MPEVARAAILPDPTVPDPEAVFTLALLWDAIEVVIIGDPEGAAETAESAFGELIEAGVVSWSCGPRFKSSVVSTENTGPPDLRTRDDARQFALRAATALTIWQVEKIHSVQHDAASRGVASIALTPFAAAAGALPPQATAGTHAEATLMQAATAGINVLPGTSAEDVLAFRERNARLMGRFRAQMVDLAESMRSDGRPEAVAEEAYAVIKNRVEPVLGDLEDVLRRGRIRYAWSMLFGASSVLLGSAAPSAAVSGGGRIATHTLDYLFDRDRLVREHPYGLLHLIRSEMQVEKASPPSGRRIVDPIIGLRDQTYEYFRAVVEPHVREAPHTSDSPSE